LLLYYYLEYFGVFKLKLRCRIIWLATAH